MMIKMGKYTFFQSFHMIIRNYCPSLNPPATKSVHVEELILSCSMETSNMNNIRMFLICLRLESANFFCQETDSKIF